MPGQRALCRAASQIADKRKKKYADVMDMGHIPTKMYVLAEVYPIRGSRGTSAS